MPIKTLDEYLKQATTRTTTKQQTTTPEYRIVGFYKETIFQQTPIGKIPKEWSITKLRNVAKINESKVNIANLEGKVARVPMELIPDDGIYTKYVLMPINEIKSYVTAKAGDILLAKITPSFENGKQGIVPDDVPHGIALVTTEVYPITPINIERLFLFYLLKWRRYRKLLEWKMTGTTGRRRVPKNALENLLIPLPPLEEQWGIAEVLSTVDKAIEETEKLIERLERLKKALIQELLTKGIGHREYKETPIGKIPKEWQVARLSTIAKIIMGQSPPSKTYNEEGIGLPFLQGKAEFDRIYPKHRLYTSKPIKIAEKNDLLISVRAPVGDVNIAPYRLCIGRGLAAIRFNSEIADILFYFYYFNFIKPRLESMGKGSTFKAITKKDLESLLVPKPPLNEQKMIAETLYSIDKWIMVEEKRKKKFERLKRGLMELLLTGRVRVRIKRVS